MALPPTLLQLSMWHTWKIVTWCQRTKTATLFMLKRCLAKGVLDLLAHALIPRDAGVPKYKKMAKSLTAFDLHNQVHPFAADVHTG